MKIDLTQQIKDLSENPVRMAFSSETQKVFSMIVQRVEKLFGKESGKKLLKSFENDSMGQKATLKAILEASLIITESKDREGLLKDYKLLKRIMESDQVDLDQTTCDTLVDRVASAYKGNALLVGRVNEMLVEKFDDKKNS